MAAVRPRQFTFNPRVTDEPVGMDLFDVEGKPVEVLVTVPACDSGPHAGLSVDPPGPKRQVVLPPGRGTTIDGLRDSEGRLLRLYLAAAACPEDGNGGGGEAPRPGEIGARIDVADVMPDVVADIELVDVADFEEAPDIELDEDFEASESLGDDDEG